MVAVIGVVIFVGAFGMAALAIAATVAPQWRRIVDVTLGRHPQDFAPLSQLVQAERRIAVRRWAAQPGAAAVVRPRAAA